MQSLTAQGTGPMANLSFRPEGFNGSVEDHLSGIQTALVKTLTTTQKNLTHDTLKLAHPHLKTLASILVEFAEDLHCGIGIWRSLEHYHREFFGIPLPLIREAEADRP